MAFTQAEEAMMKQFKNKIPEMVEYTLNSPLSLDLESQYLPVTDIHGNIVTHPLTQKPPKPHTADYELFLLRKDLCVTGDLVTRLLADLRSRGELRPDVASVIRSKFTQSFPLDSMSSILMDALDPILYSTTRSDKQQDHHSANHVWSMLNTRFFSDPEIQRLATLSESLSMAIAWSNTMEETHCSWVDDSNIISESGFTRETLAGCIPSIHQEISVSGFNPVDIWVTPRLMILMQMGVTPFPVVVRKQSLLGLKDCLIQRWITLLWSSISNVLLGASVPHKGIISKLYHIGDGVLATVGNEGYDWIKLLESFFVALAQKNADMDCEDNIGHDFYNYCARELYEKSASTNQLESYQNLIALSQNLSATECIELSGLFRHWGHPFIEVEKGLEAVHENSSKAIEVDQQFMVRLSAKMNQILLENYARRNPSKWPPGAHVQNPCTSEERELDALIRSARFPSKGVSASLGVAWASVKYDRIFTDIPDVPILELISDKRHAKTRSEIQEQIRRGATRGVPSASVVETLLLTPQIDVMEFLHEVNRCGIDKEHLIIVLRAKERELKIKGRFFSLMTFVLRVYFTATEYLLEKYILPLFPEVTMCKDQLEFTKQMLNNSRTVNHQEKETCHMISIDFEKWNNFQRAESTEPVFKMLDKAFGWDRVISRTHELFANCTVLYGNKLSEVPGDLSTNLPYVWNDHVGGFEGLRQKGWSIIGALVLRVVSEETNTKIRVLLQGDNQIIVIKYITGPDMDADERRREKQRHAKVTKRFLTQFCKRSKSIGLNTKPEETWVSCNLLYYGKWAFIDGCSQSVFLKRICRAFHTVNDLVPSITSTLSSLNTTCLSACMQVGWSAPIYVFYLWYGSMTVGSICRFNPVLGQPLWKRLQTLLKEAENDIMQVYPHINPIAILDAPLWAPRSSKWQSLLLITLLCRDSSLGGIGGSGPLRYYIRQFPDPITESLTAIKWMVREISNRSLWVTLVGMGYPHLNTDVNFEILCQDPTCLNLVGASKATNMLKDFVKRKLHENRSERINNVLIRESLHLSFSTKRNVIKMLESLDPLFPRLLSSLYSVSPLGMCEGIVSHIVGSRSSYRIASRLADPSFVKQKIFWNELLLMLTAINHFEHGRNEANKVGLWQCSTLHAAQLRSASWGRHVFGVTIPHPLEQWALTSLSSSSCGSCVNPGSNSFSQECIVLIKEERDRVVTEKVWSSRGPFECYLGGHTAERRIAQTECEMRTDEEFLAGLIRLFNLEGWCYESGSAVHRYLQAVADAYHPDLKQYVRKSFETRSGSLIHRFRDPHVSDGSGLANNPNSGSHVTISTNHLDSLGRGQENYVIMFQAIFVYWAGRALMRDFLNQSDPVITHHLHPNCNGCFPLAPDLVIDSTKDIFFAPFSSLVSLEVPMYAMGHPAIPSSLPLKLNPFEISLDKVYVNPAACIPSIPVDEHPEPIALSTACYYGVAVAVCSQLKILRHAVATDDYLIAASSLRKLSWSMLKHYLAVVTIQWSILEIILDWDVTGLSGSIFDLAKKKSCDEWSRIHDHSFGLLLMLSGHIQDIYAENVYHNAGFPVKSPQVQGSASLSVIDRINEFTTCPELPVTHVPGDMATTWSLIQMAWALCTPALLNNPLALRDAQKEMVSLRSILVNRIPLSSIITTSQTLVNNWYQKCLTTCGATGLTVIPSDLKTLCGELPQPIEADYVAPPSTLSPAIDKTREGDIVWASWSVDIQLDADKSSTPHAKSPMMHVFRPVWFSANGSLKVLSVIKALGLESQERVACIGDGNGGFTRIFATLPCVTQVWFNSLPDYANSRNQDTTFVVPSALLDLKHVRKKIVGGQETSVGISDITHASWNSYVRDTWGTLKFRPTLIFSDAEFYGESDMKSLLLNLWCLRDICPQSCVKMHLNGHTDIKDLFDQTMVFERMQIVRSAYSNMGKFEVYVHWTWAADPHSAKSNFRKSMIPCDGALMGVQRIFLNSWELQFEFIRSNPMYQFSPLEKAHVISRGLSLRCKVSRASLVRVSEFLQWEDDYQRSRLSFSQIIARVIRTCLCSGFGREIIQHSSDQVEGVGPIYRKGVLNWVAVLIAAGVLYSVWWGNLLLYRGYCRLYSMGAQAWLVTKEGRFNRLVLQPKLMQAITIQPDINAGETAHLYTFTPHELKPDLHDTVRYLGNVHFIRDKKFFRRNRSLGGQVEETETIIALLSALLSDGRILSILDSPIFQKKQPVHFTPRQLQFALVEQED